MGKSLGGGGIHSSWNIHTDPILILVGSTISPPKRCSYTDIGHGQIDPARLPVGATVGMSPVGFHFPVLCAEFSLVCRVGNNTGGSGGWGWGRGACRVIREGSGGVYPETSSNVRHEKCQSGEILLHHAMVLVLSVSSSTSVTVKRSRYGTSWLLLGAGRKKRWEDDRAQRLFDAN